jgi:hypothetical protein
MGFEAFRALVAYGFRPPARFPMRFRRRGRCDGFATRAGASCSGSTNVAAIQNRGLAGPPGCRMGGASGVLVSREPLDNVRQADLEPRAAERRFFGMLHVIEVFA